MEAQCNFTLEHIGINPGGEDAVRIAELFAAVLGVPVKEGKSSVFAGKLVEVMRQDYLGAKGHIAIGAESLEAAGQWLAERGFALDPATAKYDTDGSLKAVYLKGDFGGFAVHLLKK